MILGTAGHIDHGKTAVVRALTGIDTDRLPEEKRRGITIDLGFAPLVLDGVGTVGVVDVPGHEAFVRTMLAGATGIDMAMLVVAADEGVMPQTREHLEILSLLGIPRGVVALTKCDLVDEDWLAMVRADVETLAAGTMLEGGAIVPVSAVTGHGLDQLRLAIAAMARSSLPAVSDPDDVFRLPVDRAFTVPGTGTVVTGTVWSGQVRQGDELVIQPGEIPVRVRGVQAHGADAASACAGSRAAIALAGAGLNDVRRGSVVVGHKGWSASREMDVLVQSIDPNFLPSPRTRFRVHIGTSESGGRLSRLRALGGESMTGVARLVLDEPAIARGGDRFVLRLPSPARTVGGGEIIDPLPSTSRGAARRALGAVTAGAARDSVRRAMHLIRSSGVAGVEQDLVAIRTGLSTASAGALVKSADLLAAGDRVYGMEAVRVIESRITDAISAAVHNHPLEPGVSLQAIRAAIGAPAPVIAAVLDRLQTAGRIERDGGLVKPAGWAPHLDEAALGLRQAILHEICTGCSEPPSVGELEAKLGGDVRVLLRALERDGKLERVSQDRYYDASAAAGMIAALRSRLEPGRIYSPGELRQVLGVSRKYLIPFLEFCDRKGVTERNEQGRKVRLGASVREIVSGGAGESARA